MVGTTVEELNDGYECIAMFHLPEDLLVIDYHVADLVYCLVGLTHL